MIHKMILMGIVFLSFTFADFNMCKFNFGADWDYIDNNRTTETAKAIDYVTIWLNDPAFNTNWHGNMLRWCKNNSKTPVLYSYIIAKASGLGDGDAGGRLTTEGAAYLKNNWNTITNRYRDYASNAATYYGTDKPVIWLMEPDYFQYFSGNQSVKLSYSDASRYMNELISIIKSSLPKALISLDISPWNNDQANYIRSFDMSKFTFMNTSGGRTEANNSRIRMDNSNNVTWSQVSTTSDKGIIADDGYGTGGGSTGHDYSWDDVNNLKNRIADGVVAITQKSPNANWGTTINNLKNSLSSQKVKCSGIRIILQDVNSQTKKSSINIVGSKGNFTATLPSVHHFTSYSLYDLKGQLIYRGIVTPDMNKITFSNMSNTVHLLSLQSNQATTTVRLATLN